MISNRMDDVHVRIQGRGGLSWNHEWDRTTLTQFQDMLCSFTQSSSKGTLWILGDSCELDIKSPLPLFCSTSSSLSDNCKSSSKILNPSTCFLGIFFVLAIILTIKIETCYFYIVIKLIETVYLASGQLLIISSHLFTLNHYCTIFKFSNFLYYHSVASQLQIQCLNAYIYNLA